MIGMILGLLKKHNTTSRAKPKRLTTDEASHDTTFFKAILYMRVDSQALS
jgi:hypothetical protein